MNNAGERDMLTLLMPNRIEIVEPFTRVRSFDDDGIPDGIELLLQAVNSLGNSGNMIGKVTVGLYEYVSASGDAKGRQLEQWKIELTNRAQHRTYWNTMTQMYEFQLGIDATKIPAADKYVLEAAYTSPFGEHLVDECFIHYRPAVNPLGEAGRGGR